MSSRKFILAVIVTAVFVVFESVAVFYGFKYGNWEPAKDLAPFLVYTAGVYIAGNVVQDFSPTKETKKDEEL